MNLFRRLLARLFPVSPGYYSDLARADGLGAWWCTYGTRHDIDEDCTCAPPDNAQVLAAAFPHHPAMEDWEARDREIQDIFARYRANGGRIVPAILPPTGKAA